MEFGNCPICGKLYMKNAARMCPACLEKEEEYEKIVTAYIKDHRRCTVEEVHEATGVKESVIYRMIKSGRIQECEDLGYPCEQCGKIINKGRLCKSCMDSFVTQVKEMKTKEDEVKKQGNGRSSGGMYTKNM